MSSRALGRKVMPQESSHLVYVKTKSEINCESAIGQHLIATPECAKTFICNNFRIIVQANGVFIKCYGTSLHHDSQPSLL